MCTFTEGDLIQIRDYHFEDEDHISCECVVGIHNIETFKRVDELFRRTQIFDKHVTKQYESIIEYQPIFRDQVFMVITNMHHGIDEYNDDEVYKQLYSKSSYTFWRVYQRLNDGMLVMSSTLDELGTIL